MKKFDTDFNTDYYDDYVDIMTENYKDSEFDSKHRVLKVIDYRIPLWGVIGVVFSIIAFGLNLSFKVDSIKQNLDDSRQLIISTSITVNTLTGEVELLKYRQKLLEDRPSKK